MQELVDSAKKIFMQKEEREREQEKYSTRKLNQQWHANYILHLNDLFVQICIKMKRSFDTFVPARKKMRIDCHSYERVMLFP